MHEYCTEDLVKMLTYIKELCVIISHSFLKWDKVYVVCLFLPGKGKVTAIIGLGE